MRAPAQTFRFTRACRSAALLAMAGLALLAVPGTGFAQPKPKGSASSPLGGLGGDSKEPIKIDADKLDFAGLTFFTHKASEGTTNPDAKYGAHMAAAKAAGVPVLGSYHVLRTPGSGGAGSLAQQLAYWVARQDALTPWWRSASRILAVATLSARISTDRTPFA